MGMEITERRVSVGEKTNCGATLRLACRSPAFHALVSLLVRKLLNPSTQLYYLVKSIASFRLSVRYECAAGLMQEIRIDTLRFTITVSLGNNQVDTNRDEAISVLFPVWYDNETNRSNDPMYETIFYPPMAATTRSHVSCFSARTPSSSVTPALAE